MEEKIIKKLNNLLNKVIELINSNNEKDALILVRSIIEVFKRREEEIKNK